MIETGAAVRATIRAGEHTGPTSGLAPRLAQANLAVLPQADAFDFVRFCLRNAQACPVLEVCDPGSADPVGIAKGADLRTDVPRYRVFRDGVLTDEPTDVRDVWRDDLVAVLLGCSFTFEAALLAAGLPLAHQDQGVNVPMYETNRRCTPAGRFAGPLVVSMRPFAPANVAGAAAVSARFPAMHGAPVHAGDPGGLGIEDLGNPDFGAPVALARGEVPVFWACGVTPQAAVLEAKPELAIFHAPGHMFVTDRPHRDYDTQEVPHV